MMPPEKVAARYLPVVGRTAAFNVVTTLASAIVGVLLARVLGPRGRGDYAALTAMFTIVLATFELGLATAVVFFTARSRLLADTQVRTALVLLLPLSVAAGGFVSLAAFTSLGVPGDRRTGLFLIAGCVAVSFLATPAIFALQALELRQWNLVRLAQPLLYAAVLVLAGRFLNLDVPRVIALLGLTLVLQGALAWWLYRRTSVPQGAFSRRAVGPLLRYGLSDLASTAPNALNGRLDQIVLAVLVSSSALGQYAVAVSLSVLVSPIAAAFGNVAFPRIARGDQSEATLRHALRGSMLVGLAGSCGIVVAAPVLVPVLYGPGFQAVPRLLAVLAPGAVFYVVNPVLADVLRGFGRPGSVAASQWAGVLITVPGLIILVPHFGALGAAITSSITYFAVHVLLRVYLRRTRAAKASG
jgi:O-antigen/teichoic acid export membrane protein